MRIKQSLVLFSVILLLIASISFAFPNDVIAKEREPIGNYDKKDEVIYGNLTASGSVKEMYVVNTFHVAQHGGIIDHGNYINVRNLTNLLPIEQEAGDKVQFQADENEFYYQGELQNEPLPWDIDITYLLDGKKVDPEQLAGKNGELEIHLSTSENEEVDETFFNYYLLQVSVTLDPENFKNIRAPKGTEAKEGKNSLVSFNVMPGEEENLVLSADAESIEMEPIQISAIPANIAIDDPEFDEMKEDIQSLADAIGDINKGIGELKDGIVKLNDGTNELKIGSNEYLSGIQQLDNSSDDLISGSTQIYNALQQINDAMNEEDIDMPTEDDIKELTEGLRDLAENLQQSSEGFAMLDQLVESLPGTIDSNIFNELLGDEAISDENKQVIIELIETYEIAQGIKEINAQLIKPFIQSTDEFAEGLHHIADEIEASMSQLDELNNLIEGLTQLSSQYEIFHHGLIDYIGGVEQLSKSYREINQGVSSLAEGTSELTDGARQLHEGSAELREETKNLPNDMQSEIDEQLASFDYSDFEPTSFVSNKNEQIGVVQFVLQTERIEKLESDEEIDETIEEKGFWQRFLDLFRK